MITGFFALLQIIAFIVIVFALSSYAIPIFLTLMLISVVTVIFIINQDKNPAYKLLWSVTILSFPIFGGLMYLAASLQSSTYRFKKKASAASTITLPHITNNSQLLPELAHNCYEFSQNADYLANHASFPLYDGTAAIYLPSGEAKFELLKKEITKAKHFIFLEYFIIQEGLMWDSILKLLIEKADAGVDVRIIWDGMGCMSTLPKNYAETLRRLGIKVMVFNPFIPIATVIQNNRDHRKIVVIDGNVAFTGGINLADEYINAYARFGHWKDSAVMLKGNAASRFTLLFLEHWYLSNPPDADIQSLLAPAYNSFSVKASGFVQPYADSPLDRECVGEAMYLNLINKARRYIYIMTPYLIPNNELVTALCLAAKNGVDVRILTPHKPDKVYVFQVTRSFYGRLIDAGVRIYEYTPGFVHSKTVVSDDCIASVGSTNLDYRSLYLHFECGTLIYNSPAIADIKRDFLEAIAVSERITPERYKQIRGRHGLVMSLLRVFAPIL